MKYNYEQTKKYVKEHIARIKRLREQRKKGLVIVTLNQFSGRVGGYKY